MMPPKSRRQRQLESSLEIARDSKRRCQFEEGESSSSISGVGSARNEPEGLTDLLNLSHDALDTEDEETDPSFDLDSSIKLDSEHMMEKFCEDWVTHLSWEDRTSLGLFLCFQMTTVLRKGETEAAELASLISGKSDKTIRSWKTTFLESGGEIPESKQGHYQRTGILWQNESLNKKAA